MSTSSPSTSTSCSLHPSSGRLTAAEIGEVVDAPEGTVRTRLRRAKELVAKEMRRIENLGIPLETTIHQLDDWAADVRKGLG